VEAYEVYFFTFIHHVEYLVDDKQRVEIFRHGIDTLVRVKVTMWKPPTMETTKNLARHPQKMIDIKYPSKSFEPFKEPFKDRVIEVQGHRYGFRGGNKNVARVSSKKLWAPLGGQRGHPYLRGESHRGKVCGG